MDTRINEWTSKLQSESSSGKLLDLGNWLQWLAMDVVTDMAFGTPIGFVKQGKDIGGLIGSVQALFVAPTAMVMLPGVVRSPQLPFIHLSYLRNRLI